MWRYSYTYVCIHISHHSPHITPASETKNLEWIHHFLPHHHRQLMRQSGSFQAVYVVKVSQRHDMKKTTQIPTGNCTRKYGVQLKDGLTVIPTDQRLQVGGTLQFAVILSKEKPWQYGQGAGGGVLPGLDSTFWKFNGT